MTSRDFAYWLQGLFELGNPKALDERQTDLVKRHLAMVFVHEIDPSAGGPKEQAILNQIHGDLTKAENGLGPPKIGGHGPDGTVYRC